MSDALPAMEPRSPHGLVAEIECADRIDVELLRLELQRLVRQYGAVVKTVHLERQLD